MMKRALVTLALCALSVTPALASEGALGRPITGLQGTSFAGVVPPTPGWSLGLSYAYYAGTVSGQRESPLPGGGSALGLEVTAQLFSITGIYVWDTGEGRWNFASVAVVPFAKMDAEVDLRIGSVSGSGSVSDSDTGLFDMAFVPVIASRHFSATQHLSLALYIFAPTGSYEEGRLAELSLNNWTYSPTVGYTQLFQKGSLEFSALAAVDFYTENHATDYQNGAVFRLDSLLVKRFSNGWGVGAAGGWIEQLQDDDAEIADRLDGFKGHSLALGPVVTFAKKWEGGQVEFSARWLHEFDVKNRFSGDPFLLSASIQF
ncbi:SphA family protein [Lysobacter sp. P5_B9]